MKFMAATFWFSSNLTLHPHVQIIYPQEKEYCMLAVWDLQYQIWTMKKEMTSGF